MKLLSMKYQIILESDELLNSQEFEEWAKTHLTLTSEFKFLYAQSLQGIREELYKKGEPTTNQQNQLSKELSKLFKLD